MEQKIDEMTAFADEAPTANPTILRRVVSGNLPSVRGHHERLGPGHFGQRLAHGCCLAFAIGFVFPESTSMRSVRAEISVCVVRMRK
jgi:hypothetical protein